MATRLSDIGNQRTRTPPRYGTLLEREGNWWGAVKNAYMLDTSVGQAVGFAATANAFGVPWQSTMRRVVPDYSPYDEDLTGFELYLDEFNQSTSPEETAMIKQQIENNIDLRQSLDGWGGTRLFAGLLDPINLIPVPFALGKGFIEGATTALKYGAPVVAGTEIARHLLDPTSTLEETAFAALGGTLFMGLIGGGVGKIPKGTMTVTEGLNKFIPPQGQTGMSLGVPVTGSGASVGKGGVKTVMRKIWRTMNSEVTMGEPAWKKVDPETVRLDIDDDYGEFHKVIRVIHKDGEVLLEGIDNGKGLQINSVYVPKTLQRQGFASYAIRQAVQYAEKNRLKIVSDTAMSDDAMLLWKSLDKEGYKIKENPNWRRGGNAEKDGRVSTDGEPLFEAVHQIDPDATAIPHEYREALLELESESNRMKGEHQTLSKIVKDLKQKVKKSSVAGGAKTKATQKLKIAIAESRVAQEEARIAASLYQDLNVKIALMLDKQTIKDWSLLPTGYNTLLGKLNQMPWWRLMQTDLREIAPDLAVKYQMFALEIASTPGLNNKGNRLSAATNAPVESRALEHAGAWLGASRKARSIYRKYAGYGETSGEVKHFMIDQSQRVRATLNKFTDADIPLTPSGKMTYQEFNKQISVAIANGGKHKVNEVAKAAAGYVDAIEEIGAQISEFGISATQQNIKRAIEAVDRRIADFDAKWGEKFDVGDGDAQTARFQALNKELKALDAESISPEAAALDEIDALVAKRGREIDPGNTGSTGDPNRLRARVADDLWEELSPRTQETLLKQPSVRDLETGEINQIGGVSEISGGGNMNIHGGHMAELELAVQRSSIDPYIKDAEALGIKNPEEYVALTRRVVSAEKDDAARSIDPDTGENFTIAELVAQAKKEGVDLPLGAEFSRRRGYTPEEIDDFVNWRDQTQAYIDSGEISSDELASLTAAIDGFFDTPDPRRVAIEAELDDFYARDRKPMPPGIQGAKDKMLFERMGLEERNAKYVEATNKEFIHRMWIAEAVVENEAVLKALLVREFTKNPIPGKTKVAEGRWVDNNSSAAIEARANEAYASILHEADSGNNSRFKPESTDTRPWLEARREAVLNGEAGVPPDVAEVQVAAIDRKLEMIKEGKPINGSSGPLIERRLDLNDSELIDLGLIESDVDVWMQHYVHRTAPMIETARVFGDARASKHIAELHDEVFIRALDAEEAGDMKLAKRLYKEAEEGLLAMNNLRDIVQGNYQIADNVDAITPRVLRMLRNFNILGAMGRSVFMALGDIGNVVMSQGLVRSIGHAAESFGAGIKDGNIAMMRHEVDLAGSVSEVILGQRYHQMTDFGVAVGSMKYPGMAKFERKLAGMSQRFFLYNLLGPWTDMARRFSGGMLQSRLIENSILWKSGKLSQDEQTIMTRLHINKQQAIQFADEWEASGQLKHGSMYIANTTEWTSKEAVRTFRAGMNTEINRMVPTPGAVDKPLALLKGEWWKVIGQYRGFSIAATHRIMGAGIHQKGAQKYSGIASMIGIAMMVDALKRPDYIQMPIEEQLLRAVELSGVTGIILDLNDTIERATAGSLGIRPVFGMDIRERSPNWANRMGTLGAVPNQWLTLMYGLTADEAETDDLARAIRYMIPYNNLLWWNEAFNRAQRSAVDFIEDRQE